MPTFIEMIVDAIGHIKSGSQGASRAAIAAYICQTYQKQQTGQFNASLRAALKKGIESGALRQGVTLQRFKLGENARKKPAASAKKTAAKKKKVTPKKKAAAKKKKATPKKKKTPAKKKTVAKKKPAAKSAKKTTKKSRK